jgi:hypothetical protein
VTFSLARLPERELTPTLDTPPVYEHRAPQTNRTKVLESPRPFREDFTSQVVRWEIICWPKLQVSSPYS